MGSCSDTLRLVPPGSGVDVEGGVFSGGTVANAGVVVGIGLAE